MQRRSFLLTAGALAATRAFSQDRDEAAGPDWFPFEPEDDFTGPSVIGMADWLERPAGKHGFVQVKGDRLVFEDGVPVKFWGTNVCNGRVARPKEGSGRVADRFAKYGVNLVRMHKFTWPGERAGIGSAGDSTLLDESLAERWDYFSAALAARGIYSGWSHIFGHRLSPADRERVAAYDELMNADLPWDYLRRSTIGLVNFAPDLQQLNIALTVNMLNRVNRTTGRRYAEDTALAFIELQNEDDVFWGHTQIYMDRCPTYKRMFQEQFSKWLRAKYGSEEKLLAAWGKDSLAAGESLDQSSIAAGANTEMSGRIRKAASAGEPVPRRLLDNCLFLHETQNRFYSRFAEAIRGTGYKGAIVGSCWQAGSGVSHYYNLLSDRLAGLVDRHNYSGGVRANPGQSLAGRGSGDHRRVWDGPAGLGHVRRIRQRLRHDAGSADDLWRRFAR
jgi:hypothetical protein